MPNYQRKPYKLMCRGIGLRHPPDLLPDGLYPILNNMIPRVLGGLQPRAGITTVTSGFNYGSPVHSIRRLNDPTNNTFMRLIGAGTSIFDTGSNTPIDTGYSGSPLSMVPFRPVQSPSPWMYISDGTKSRKVRTDRTNFSQGTPPPTQPVTVARGVPNYTIVEQFNAVGSWTVSGTAGAISTPNRFSSTISAITYDTGSSGWVLIKPASMDANYQPGALIIINGSETVKIREVYQPIATTTIAAIMYDSGTSGLCSIVLTGQSSGIVQDSMMLLNAEYVRVLSVATALDGTVSLRCSTISTHTAGDPVTGIASFRTWTSGTHLVTETLTGAVFESAITVGTGWLTEDLSGSPVNLGVINNRPVQQEDYLHISFQVSNPSLLSGLRIIINTDQSFPASPAFINNGFYKDITPSLFQSLVNSAQNVYSAQQSALQQLIVQYNTAVSSGNNLYALNLLGQISAASTALGIPASQIQVGSKSLAQTQGNLNVSSAGTLTIPNFVPVSPDGLSTTPASVPTGVQLVAGNENWTEILIPLSSMSTIGSSKISSLSAVTGLIIQVQATGSINFFVSSWWIGGTYGMDSTGSVPYTIYERFRSAQYTGTKSNPSPIMRAAIDLQRERAVVTPTTSADGQIDTIDLFTIGGTLTQPMKSASLPNSSTPFNLDVTDSAIAVNEVLSFTNFQPFPISDLPRSGTVNVVGTSVQWVSGDTFNVNWQAGSQIIINSSVYTLYAPPSSSIRLQLIENAGNHSGASFSIPEATIGGQPLPSMWGPDPQTGVLFAVGTGKDAGTLYWTNPNDPDTASDTNAYEITSPSEPLINGFMYDGRSYVWSSEQLYSCYAVTTTSPTTGIQTLSYQAQPVVNGKGLFGQFAFCVGAGYYGTSKTGIYAYGDTETVGTSLLNSITDESLYPLFPHMGQNGDIVNGYFPINTAQSQYIRLAYTKGGIYLTYMDTDNSFQTMLLFTGIPQPGWFPLQFTPTARVIYEEEGEGLTSVLMGASDGTVHLLNQGISDNSTAINFNFYTPSFDLGDSRTQKLWLDYMIDLDAQSVPLSLTPFMNNLQRALSTVSSTLGTGRQQVPEDLITDPLELFLNASLNIAGSTVLGTPEFYEIQFNAVIQPYLAVNMTSPNYVSHGFQTYGHVRDSWFVWISTTTVTVEVLTDSGQSYTFNLPSSGNVIAKRYFPLAALKGLLFFYQATSTSPFAIFTDETIIHVKEWGSDGAYIPFKPYAGQS